MENEQAPELVNIVTPVEPPAMVEANTLQEELPEETQPEPTNNVEDLSDLTKVTKEDILGKHDGNSDPESIARDIEDLTTISDDEMDDLFNVTEADIMGTPPKKTVRRFKRTNRVYIPPQTGMRGMR